MLPFAFVAALTAQAPDVEAYFDRQAPEADLVDAFDLPLADRIVRFPRRSDAIALTALGAVVWSQSPPVRRVRWQIALGVVVAFDALLVPSPRAVGPPRLERLRRRRCAQLVNVARGHELDARLFALGCAS
ncbi:MAG: hypothetical protein RMA76_34320 [Deltaproteobacteria bacterium]|jgi:hypothetical protein